MVVFYQLVKCGGKVGKGLRSLTCCLLMTLIFCEAREEQMMFLCWLLMWFETISSLKVNLDISEPILVGRVENVDDLLGEMGCKVGSLSSTYLGMPLGASFNSVVVWDGIEERLHKRLALWKQHYISKKGRIILICSSLSSPPIYFMSILHMPRVVRVRLERIQRDFLWGGGTLERKPHLVRWSTVCLDKSKGGLGVKSLATLNKTLLGKWTWHFANEREAFWNQVTRRKYKEDQGRWFSREVKGRHGVGLWKAIRNLGHLVSSRVSFVAGNGQRVSVWKDKWYGNSPLCNSFLSLFVLAAAKEVWVSDLWTVSASGVLGGVGILCLLGVSIIGSWMRWTTCWCVCARKE